MFRRLAVVASVTSLFVVLVVVPSNAIIHELVASHCAGHQGSHGNVDPPGQLNTKGNSFARALQASGVYTLFEGEDAAGEFGLDFSGGEPPVVGPLPAPPAGTFPFRVEVDATRPNAKLGDFMFWVLIVDDDPAFEVPIAVYLEIYELDHPAFKKCKNFPSEP